MPRKLGKPVNRAERKQRVDAAAGRKLKKVLFLLETPADRERRQLAWWMRNRPC